MATGILATSMLACTSAQAQTTVEIRNRIESTFGLVLANPEELAVPLTRRALVRRSIEREDAVEPLPYRATGEGVAVPATPEPAVSAETEAEEIEQGSAADDTELARLPRPRPMIISEAPGTPDLIGQPLDLVAGAAVAVAEEEQGAASVARAEEEPAGRAEGEAAAERAAPNAETEVLIAPVEASSDERDELIAADACMSLDALTDEDGDFKRNAEALSADGMCIAQEEFKERRRPWIVHTVKSQRPGPLWAVMHDDEDLSFDNAVEALGRYGGTLISVESGGDRNLSGVDPNRNFSADGIGCRKLGDDASPRFTGFFADHIDPSQPIVALHNNSEERIPTGGLGHVAMHLVPKSMRASRAREADGPLAGKYALVLLAAPDLDDPMAQSRTAVLNGKGINVVLERVREGRGDCSLSNYAVLTGNPNYFNVTVGEGESDKQMRIVEALMSGRSEQLASQ